MGARYACCHPAGVSVAASIPTPGPGPPSLGRFSLLRRGAALRGAAFPGICLYDRFHRSGRGWGEGGSDDKTRLIELLTGCNNFLLDETIITRANRLIATIGGH